MKNNLKNVLLGNSIFSVISSAICILFAQRIAYTFGINTPIVITLTGVSLFVFAFSVWLVAEKFLHKKTLIKSIITMDFAWVSASIYVILLNPFSISLTGLIIIAIVGISVLLFGIFQTKELRKIK